MIRNVRFWILLVAFQVVFGLLIFAFTRQYYLHGPESLRAQPPATRQQPLDWPERDVKSDLESFLSLSPGGATANDPAALLQAANDFFANGQYVEAADRYSRALAAGAKNVNTYNSLGITLQYLGRSPEALRALNEGIALDPTYQRIWLTLGFVNSQMGDIEHARKALTTAVQMGADTDIGQAATEMLENLP
jgi:tetratricopeptide (TPR) repeat protein